MSCLKKPVLAVTMGDPAGNGPELTIRSLSKRDIRQKCLPISIADANMIEKARKILKRDDLVINRIKDVNEAIDEDNIINVLHMDLIDESTFEFGKVSKQCGEAAFRCVEKAIQLAMENKVDGTVTNALNKEAINLAGHHYNGHTEIYAEKTKTEKYSMMLACKDLRVVHVSTHVSLREACDRVKKERVLEVIKIAYDACRDLGIESPSIGVAGLNPHAGENGMFGREEIDEIIPAIEEAKKEGINAIGPVPPDTAFSKALGGWYDIVVCMYHDQGHIPLKVKGFVYNKELKKWDAVEGVNVTLGLPVIRVSVDHGTAFGHAGQGVANELSLDNAIDYAVRFAEERIKREQKGQLSIN